MDRAENAVAFKHSGFNCAQAVLLAFEDSVELTKDQLIGLGACFGAGMGTFDATCGALCGAQMLQGLLKPKPGGAKKMHDRFAMLCGSVDCGELKGRKGGKVLCSCDDCVRHAVRLLEADD
ncbi:MAG: C_GCAxxG_C_C family protein [Ruminococcus sp.]|nr:C_GCAxxG_C_C family protein [Ruminococcus sp.]